MKTNTNTKCWLGLVLACGIITFAVSAQAGKPVKPPKPPPEPPSALYDLVLLGDPGSNSQAVDVNESGLVVGSGDYYSRTTLVVPEVDNGTILWRKDADSDGHNDLLVDLGTAAGATPDTYPCNINDHGVILGGGNRLFPGADVPMGFAWVLPPQVINGRLTWTDLDNDGVNGMITPLPVVATDDPNLEAMPQRINNHGEVALVVQLRDGWQRGFLLAPNLYQVSPDGMVTIEYPEAGPDGDGLNASLIDLGSGARVLDGAARPLLPTVINDRGDLAGMVWGRAYGAVNGERPFVLRPRVDEDGGLVWNEDKDGDGLNDLVIYLPLPAAVIDAASRYAGISHISDMNESGTILGGVYYGSAKGSRVAIWQVVDWDAGTVSYAELGVLSGKYDVTDARAINAGGQVVGRSLRYMKFPTIYQKAWLWDQGSMVSLSDLVPPETGLADISSVAWSINDSGMIVGAQQSVNPGYWTSFIAVPVAGQ